LGVPNQQEELSYDQYVPFPFNPVPLFFFHFFCSPQPPAPGIMGMKLRDHGKKHQ
jgi:hypothetical protein